MFLNHSSPWTLKAFVVSLLWMSRTASPLGMPQVIQQATLAVAVQAVMLGPSVLLPVRDRVKTTRLVCETAIMVSLVCLVLYAGATQRVRCVDAAVVLHMCTLHLFYRQAVEMQKSQRLVVGEQMLAWVALLCSVVLPAFMVQQTPGGMPGLGSTIIVLFSGEFMGLVSSLVASVVAALATEYEAAMTGHRD
jgi:hypothetical protein